MDFDVINATAQVVAAAGVILTLYYLAAQIRQNTRALRRSAYQELLNYITNVNLMLTADRGLCELSIRARGGLGALDEADQMRMLAWYGTVFRHYQNAFTLHHEGVITTRQWESMSAPLDRHVTTAGGRDMWHIISQQLLPDFRAFVEARIARLPAA
ncbi:MAG: hypothetical protein RLW62_10750 [Gammaproteobacteria bacterium]